MAETVITAENLGKWYALGAKRERYETLRDKLAGTLASPFQRFFSPTSGLRHPTSENFIWALRNVSFEVNQGETIGIIGRNGAGKSTLLKILSRITRPTEGRVSLRGRVASLLEVGTGFHPELTGRENIFLNGAILGMTKREIKHKFDEIVAFAEIEKFLDTPVKRYSSGMYVRLAFAVAAHLEPEILLVDEVLAVGDAAFQKKCLGKMSAVAEQGRTVLLVSHNMGAIKQFCRQAIVLDAGRIVFAGDTPTAVSTYLKQEYADAQGVCTWDQSSAPGDEHARLYSMRICAEDGEGRTEFGTDETIGIEIRYAIHRRMPLLRIGFSLHSLDGTYLFYSSDDDMEIYAGQVREPGTYTSYCRIPKNWLNTGAYYVVVSGDIFGVRTVFGGLPRLRFTVVSTGGPTSRFSEKKQGVLCPSLPWEIRAEQ